MKWKAIGLAGAFCLMVLTAPLIFFTTVTTVQWTVGVVVVLGLMLLAA